MYHAQKCFYQRNEVSKELSKALRKKDFGVIKRKP
jgi:hypothetical protein